MDAILFALALEVVLLQMRILESTSELRYRKKTESKPEKAQREKLVRDRSRGGILNELITKRTEWTLELCNADQKIAQLRDKMKDEMQNANARLCYVDKWLFARHESLEMQWNLEPRAPAPSLNHENRVHAELVRAYELQIEERECTLQYWKQKYLDDTANINERLTNKCEQLRQVVAKREELQKLFDLHAGEMRAWLTFKSERAARLAREKLRKDAATRLQAWWRGIMVRRALGSFRHLKNLKKTPTKKKK
ncbi:unnamed protein product [Diatraea saccharalis]|uniref:Dynein regulatory complex protein 9 n=1 Tax=Diatraea saccharalis TaxID=40085 RepID=A0A9N9N4V8_9NEOP|nr:unnamed protein product [Diatraea saccharalis]